ETSNRTITKYLPGGAPFLRAKSLSMLRSRYSVYADNPPGYSAGLKVVLFGLADCVPLTPDADKLPKGVLRELLLLYPTTVTSSRTGAFATTAGTSGSLPYFVSALFLLSGFARS